MSLDFMGLEYGTDKASNGHDYLRIYEKYLSPMKDEPINFLELGWWDGASMRMWREYFSQAQIIGLDIEPKPHIPGVSFVHAPQDDRAVAYEVKRRYGLLDVIVDDASHVSPLTIASFRAYWEYLKPGGLYFVEDLQVSYHKDWAGHPDPKMKGNRGMTIMQFLKSFLDDVHYGHAEAGPSINQYGVDHVAFYPGLCVLRKASV